MTVFTSIAVSPYSRMQTLANQLGTKAPSTLEVLKLAVVKDGIQSLYTGLSASLMRQLSYSMVRIGSYEDIKRRLSRDEKPTTGKLLVAAGIAGGLGGVAGNPAGSQRSKVTVG